FLVIVERVLGRRALLRSGAARLRDVVDEGRQPHHQVGRSEIHAPQRVLPDVPAVIPVLREPHRLEQLGNDAREQTRAEHAPENGSRSTPSMGSQAIAFTVKSRRARSPSMSPRNVTALGRRPSRYGPSPRNVVTSTLCSPVTTVTVPCCIPVGTTRGKSFTT